MAGDTARIPPTTPSSQGDTPNFDRLWAECPHALMRASEEDVGLPHGQIGNSEVGHMNLGAGRVVLQDLQKIAKAIADGAFAPQPGADPACRGA